MKKYNIFFFLFFFYLCLVVNAIPTKHLTLNGTQCMIIPNHDDFNVSIDEDFTVSMWVNVSSYGNNGRFLGKRDIGVAPNMKDRPAYELWGTSPYSGKSYAINVPNQYGGNVISVYSGVDNNLSTWMHVSLVIDRTLDKVLMYQNGNLVKESTNSIQNYAILNSYDVLVGCGFVNGEKKYYMTGDVANIRFYKKALTAEEIKLDKETNEYVSLSEDLKNSAVGVYEFDESNINEDNEVTDLSGHEHKAQLEGYVSSDPNISSVEVVANTTFTGRNNTKEPIHLLKVEFGGNENVNLSSLTFNLEGTTSISDISKVRFFSTETDDLYSDQTLLGEIEPSTGDLECTLSGQLKKGFNYIWLTVDVASDAKEGNKIDARIKEIKTANQTFAVTNGDPSGDREILLARKRVFTPGDYGSKNYRIPALIRAKDNSLVVATDKRKFEERDLDADIDVVIRRSEDNGQTWSKPVTIAEGKGLGKGYGDAALVQSGEEGGLLCAFVGGNGLWNSTPTNRIESYICKSLDNGKTWTTPRRITDFIYGDGCSDVSRKTWRASFFGSGNGLRTRDGRIMFVAAIRKTLERKLYNYVIYSDDNGETWQISEEATQGGDEAKVVELNDGTILMSIRKRGMRLYNTSTDGGVTWRKTREWSDIIANACNGDLIRYTSTKDGYNTNRLLHSVPNANDLSRKDVTVFVSYDEGTTWGTKKNICPYESVYSSLTILSNGTIGAYVEENPKGACELYFMNFSLEWLTNGADHYEEPGKEKASKPMFTPEDGTVFLPQNENFVTISVAKGATIYYTIDGSIPTVESTVYTAAIPVTEAITIKAIAVEEGKSTSLVAEAAYYFPKYCTRTEIVTRTDRELETVGFEGENVSFTSTPIHKANPKTVYVDKTDESFAANAGQEITPELDFKGEWMHAYIFIDYNQDLDFEDEGEAVSYNFYSESEISEGVNSLGESVQSSCGVTTTNVPAFTLPSNLQPGVYRVRVKIDWNSLDPCGKADIAGNGGSIVDFSMNILKSTGVDDLENSGAEIVETESSWGINNVLSSDKIEIFNSIGQKVYQVAGKNGYVDLSDLNSGVYLVRVNQKVFKVIR